MSRRSPPPSPETDTPQTDTPQTGAPSTAVIRAENGDVIRADQTGLVLRLSDRVIEDIAERLAARGLLADLAPGQADPEAQDGAEIDDDAIELPEGIDAWSPRREGPWLRFTANMAGKTGTRAFLCKARSAASFGAIIADTPTPLLGILAIGGPRAGLASDRACDFPHHILAPGDDIGAVGLFGEEPAKPVEDLHLLRELTHEAKLAEVLLHDALERRDALPLYFVRAETDGATNAAELAQGQAFANLVQAARNLKSAAATLGKRAELKGIFLDFVLEDVLSTPLEYRDAMIALMENITGALTAEGIPVPRFLAFFECGTPEVTEDSTLEGQWELSWNAGGHNLVMVAPSYMLELDADARLPDGARALRAAISAEALAFDREDARWFCPVLHLAEAKGAQIQVMAQCHGGLVLDADDPFGSGPHFGFALEGVDAGVEITQVEIDPKDPKALVITCSGPVAGPDPVLRYASGRPAGQRAGQCAGFPANCGALRDAFAPRLVHDTTKYDPALLRRWALPARLKITKGPLQ